MKLNTPLPQPLPKECAKAARIFKSFVDHGLDRVIPKTILHNAKGFAIFTVFKAGFLFSGAGSGIVVARLPDGSWSAPSAIGTAGLGEGTQAGAEMTDFLIVLNTQSVIKSFMAAGSLMLGGNLSIALGPFGHNDEALGSLNTSGKLAAMYSYSKTKGLFGGISVEGSVISERQDANTLAYQSDVSVKSLLSGIVPRPDWAQPLYQTLDTWAKSRGGQHEWIDDSPAQGQGYATPTFKTHFESDFNPQNEWFTQAYDFRSSARNWSYASRGPTMPVPFAELTSNTRGPLDSKPDGELFDEPVWIRPIITPKAGLTASLTPGEGARRAVALFDFNAIEPGDISFSKGEIITITQKTETTDTWWTGEANGRSGKFPANHVEVREAVGRAVALFDFNAVEPGDISFSKGEVITITQKTETTDTWWTGEANGRSGTFPANYVEVV